MSELPPSGWYTDTTDSGRMRWWDGTDWTSHYQDSSENAQAAASSPPRESTSNPWFKKKRSLVAMITTGAVIAAIAVFSLLPGNSGEKSDIKAAAAPAAFVFTDIEEMKKEYLTIGTECDPLATDVLGARVDLYTCDGATVGLLYESSIGDKATVKLLADIRQQDGEPIHADDWTWAVTIHADTDPKLADQIAERFKP